MNRYVFLVTIAFFLNSCNGDSKLVNYSFDAGKYQVAYNLYNPISSNYSVSYSDYNSDIVYFQQTKFYDFSNDTSLLTLKQIISNSALCNRSDSSIFVGHHFILNSSETELTAFFDTCLINGSTRLHLTKYTNSFVLTGCFSTYSYFTLQVYCKSNLAMDRIISSITVDFL